MITAERRVRYFTVILANARIHGFRLKAGKTKIFGIVKQGNFLKEV